MRGNKWKLRSGAVDPKCQFASKVTSIQQRRDWRLGEGNPCIALFAYY